jgi:hypothetical protein
MVDAVPSSLVPLDMLAKCPVCEAPGCARLLSPAQTVRGARGARACSPACLARTHREHRRARRPAEIDQAIQVLQQLRAGTAPEEAASARSLAGVEGARGQGRSRRPRHPLQGVLGDRPRLRAVHGLRLGDRVHPEARTVRPSDGAHIDASHRLAFAHAVASDRLVARRLVECLHQRQQRGNRVPQRRSLRLLLSHGLRRRGLRLHEFLDARAQSSPACDFNGSCMNCLGGAAGIICNCSDAGPPSTDGGAQWQCTGTEQACTGGTFHG